MSRFPDSELVTISEGAVDSLAKIEEIKGCLEDFLVAINECISFDVGGPDREELERVVEEKAGCINDLVESLLDE